VNAILSREFQSRSNRVHIVPGRYTINEGCVHISPFSLNGSADIIGCTGSNCLAVIEEGTKILEKGTRVNAVLLDAST
jgi:molybdopterin biosynthesis enzyme